MAPPAAGRGGSVTLPAMTTPDPDDAAATGVLAAIPLDYDRPARTGWEPMIRLMGLAVLVQGAALALGFGFQLAQAWIDGLGSFRAGGGAQWFGTTLELGRGAVAAGLMGAGWMAVHGRPVGRRLVGPLELALAACGVGQAGANIWLYQRYQLPPNQALVIDLGQILYLPAGLLLPVLMWLFFRRPEVRAAFTGA